MPKSWFNNGYKYMMMYSVKKRTKTTKTFEKISNNIDVPKTIYSDQGSDLSEFKNTSFQNFLDKHNIKYYLL